MQETTEKTEKMVKLTKEQYESLLANNQQLEERLQRIETGGIQKLKKVQNHHAIMREWDGKLIVETISAQENLRAENADERIKATVIVWDGEKEEKVVLNWPEVLRDSERIEIEFLKIDKEEFSTSDPRHGGGGQINRVDEKTGAFTPDIVDLEVTKVIEKPKVKVLSGKFEGKILEPKMNCFNL